MFSMSDFQYFLDFFKIDVKSITNYIYRKNWNPWEPDPLGNYVGTHHSINQGTNELFQTFSLTIDLSFESFLRILYKIGDFVVLIYTFLLI